MYDDDYDDKDPEVLNMMAAVEKAKTPLERELNLLNALRHMKDGMRLSAAIMVNENDSKAVKNRILEMAYDPDMYVQEVVANQIGTIFDPKNKSARNVLVNLLDSCGARSTVGRNAAVSLGHMGDSSNFYEFGLHLIEAGEQDEKLTEYAMKTAIMKLLEKDKVGKEHADTLEWILERYAVKQDGALKELRWGDLGLTKSILTCLEKIHGREKTEKIAIEKCDTSLRAGARRNVVPLVEYLGNGSSLDAMNLLAEHYVSGNFYFSDEITVVRTAILKIALHGVEFDLDKIWWVATVMISNDFACLKPCFEESVRKVVDENDEKTARRIIVKQYRRFLTPPCPDQGTLRGCALFLIKWLGDLNAKEAVCEAVDNLITDRDTVFLKLANFPDLEEEKARMLDAVSKLLQGEGKKIGITKLISLRHTVAKLGGHAGLKDTVVAECAELLATPDGPKQMEALYATCKADLDVLFSTLGAMRDIIDFAGSDPRLMPAVRTIEEFEDSTMKKLLKENVFGKLKTRDREENDDCVNTCKKIIEVGKGPELLGLLLPIILKEGVSWESCGNVLKVFGTDAVIAIHDAWRNGADGDAARWALGQLKGTLDTDTGKITDDKQPDDVKSTIHCLISTAKRADETPKPKKVLTTS